MIETDRCGRNEVHPCPFQKFPGAFCSCPDDQGIGVEKIAAGDFTPLQIHNIGVSFQNPMDEWDFLVDNEFHRGNRVGCERWASGIT